MGEIQKTKVALVWTCWALETVELMVMAKSCPDLTCVHMNLRPPVYPFFCDDFAIKTTGINFNKVRASIFLIFLSLSAAVSLTGIGTQGMYSFELGHKSPPLRSFPIPKTHTEHRYQRGTACLQEGWSSSSKGFHSMTLPTNAAASSSTSPCKIRLLLHLRLLRNHRNKSSETRVDIVARDLEAARPY